MTSDIPTHTGSRDELPASGRYPDATAAVSDAFDLLADYRLVGSNEEVAEEAEDVRRAIRNPPGIIDVETTKGRITAAITESDSVMLREQNRSGKAI